MSNCRLQRYERRQSARPVGDANFPVYGLDRGEFTEGRELDRKWQVPKACLSQEEAKRLLAKLR